METEDVTLSFRGLSAADANRAAVQLRERLLKFRPEGDLEVVRKRDNPAAMDGGATLVLIFGTGAAVAIAQGIAAWLVQQGGAANTKATQLVIKTSEGDEVFATGAAATNIDAAKLAESLKKHAKRPAK